MAPSTAPHFDVHGNYDEYLEEAIAKAMDRRHTHSSRSERLSKSRFGATEFKALWWGEIARIFFSFFASTMYFSMYSFVWEISDHLMSGAMWINAGCMSQQPAFNIGLWMEAGRWEVQGNYGATTLMIHLQHWLPYHQHCLTNFYPIFSLLWFACLLWIGMYIQLCIGLVLWPEPHYV